MPAITHGLGSDGDVGGVGVGVGSVTITRMSLFSLYIRSRSLPKYHSRRPWKTNWPASFALLVNVTARCFPDPIW